MDRCDVLLTDAVGKVGIQVERSLSRHGLIVRRATAPDPDVNERGFINAILRQAEESGCRAIIPIFHQEVIAKYRDEFEHPEKHRESNESSWKGTAVICESAEKIALLDSKSSACDLAERLGIQQPQRYDGPDEITRYPVVFKRSYGLGGSCVYFPGSRKTLENLIRKAGNDSPLITEYIEGTDWSVDAIRWNRYFQASPYRTIFPGRKINSIIRETAPNPQLVEISRKILDSIDYNGVCGIDFRIDNEGRAYFLECNPRFSGGTGTQIAAGFDTPFILWQLSNGQPAPEPARIKKIRTVSIKALREYARKKISRRRLTLRDLRYILWPGTFRTDDL